MIILLPTKKEHDMRNFPVMHLIQEKGWIKAFDNTLAMNPKTKNIAKWQHNRNRNL
jgi:hypothetical protein